jgi:hypothetical protein
MVYFFHPSHNCPIPTHFVVVFCVVRRYTRASALGELAALEEVIKLLVTAGRVPANGAVMRALWAQATAKERAPEAGGESNVAGRAAALNVLAMGAATHPEVVAPHVAHVAAALDAACGGNGSNGKRRPAPTLARAAAALLSRARPGGNAGTAASAGVAAPALAADHPAFAALAKVLSPVGLDATFHSPYIRKSNKTPIDDSQYDLRFACKSRVNNSRTPDLARANARSM